MNKINYYNGLHAYYLAPKQPELVARLLFQEPWDEKIHDFPSPNCRTEEVPETGIGELTDRLCVDKQIVRAAIDVDFAFGADGLLAMIGLDALLHKAAGHGFGPEPSEMKICFIADGTQIPGGESVAGLQDFVASYDVARFHQII